jgi:hypothetical protein
VARSSRVALVGDVDRRIVATIPPFIRRVAATVVRVSAPPHGIVKASPGMAGMGPVHTASSFCRMTGDELRVATFKLAHALPGGERDGHHGDRSPSGAGELTPDELARGKRPRGVAQVGPADPGHRTHAEPVRIPLQNIA